MFKSSFRYTLLLVAIIAITCSIAMGQEVTFTQTGTGFFYPTGIASNQFAATCGTWLGRDRANGGCYTDGYYHIGQDIMANYNTPVYAVANGVVTYRSTNGWGTGNIALVVKHTLSDGRQFLAWYGHITTNLQAGALVSGGTEIGRIGIWSNGNHVHFGVVPSTVMPATNHGMMPNSSWASTNTFTNPITWINGNTPKCGDATSQSYRPGGAMPYHPNGTLIRTASDPTVYVLQYGYKRAIPTAQRLYELYGPGRGFDFRDVIMIAADEMASYPRGADVTAALPNNNLHEPDGRLIRQRGGTEIALVSDNGYRRPFSSGKAFLNLGYLLCNVATVDDYYSYPLGGSIDW
jgi:hypothetical protein